MAVKWLFCIPTDWQIALGAIQTHLENLPEKIQNDLEKVVTDASEVILGSGDHAKEVLEKLYDLFTKKVEQGVDQVKATIESIKGRVKVWCQKVAS